jgi:hypothetical protein
MDTSTLPSQFAKESKDYQIYRLNLNYFLDLVERYTIADLETMIMEIPARSSGGCGYPAIQTLISLLELLGDLKSSGLSDQEAFTSIFCELGEKYNKRALAGKMYNRFRHGIAHTSLAKTNVWVSKGCLLYTSDAADDM